jgi:hypothetical protein
MALFWIGTIIYLVNILGPAGGMISAPLQFLFGFNVVFAFLGIRHYSQEDKMLRGANIFFFWLDVLVVVFGILWLTSLDTYIMSGFSFS